MVTAFDAYRRRSTPSIIGVAAVHLLASMLTTLNSIDDGCVVSLGCEAAMVLITGAIAFATIRREGYRSKLSAH